MTSLDKTYAALVIPARSHENLLSGTKAVARSLPWLRGFKRQCPKDCTASLRGRAWRAIAGRDSALLRHHRGSRGPARCVQAVHAAENPSPAKRARSRGRFLASRRVQVAGGLDAQAGPNVLAEAPACLACQDPSPSFVARTPMRDLDLPRWTIAGPVAARPCNSFARLPAFKRQRMADMSRCFCTERPGFMGRRCRFQSQKP